MLTFFIVYLIFLILTSNPSKAADLLIQDPLPSCKGFKIYNSLDATSSLGFTVSGGGGDINDDQIPDIIVSNFQTSGTSTVYVIYGTKIGYKDTDVGTMTSSQGFRISGVTLYAPDNRNLISSTGDVDGDGISDIVIGAAGESSQVGAVYVIYGKKGGYQDFAVSSLTPSKGFKITGYGGAFGANIDTRADFNGDGIADIMIGASHTSPYVNTGAGYVIYGQKARESDLIIPSMASTRGFVITGYSPAYVGVAVRSAGDFNGDKIDDLIITAPGDSLGKAYVIYGQKDDYPSFTLNQIASDKSFILTGTSPAYVLGNNASPAGDFNNDKVPDIMVASFASPSFEGSVFILYGKTGDPADLPTSPIPADRGFQLHGLNPGDLLGSSLASTEDINGDGITDIIIAAKGENSNAGAVYVIYGREDQPSAIDLSILTPEEGVKILGSGPGATFGLSLKDLGDINQDGVPDILIGAPGESKAYVLFGQNAWGCDTCSSSSACKKCSSGYGYTFNGACFRECPVSAPYKVGFTCYSEDPNPIQGALKGSVAKGAAATGAANNVLNLWSPADALPFIYGQLKTSIIYMRYMNISRTNKLEELYKLYFDSDTNVIPFVSMSNTIKDAFPQGTLPYMFRKYSLPSSFIANFGDDLLGLLIIFGLFLLTKLTSFVINKWIRNLPTLRIILHRVYITLQNFFVGSFAESLGPIIFYATLEFRNSNHEEEYYILSPFACSISLILGVSIMIACGWILQQFEVARKASRENDPSQKKKESHPAFERLEKKYEGVAVLFEEFDHSSLFTQSAFLLFSIKAVIESLIIGLLFKYPLAQAILLLLLTFMLLAYNIIKKPFKSKIDLVQQLVLILLLLVCNSCLTMMAERDPASKNYQTIKENTSNLIFWILVMFQFIPLAFFAVKLIDGMWRLYKFLSLQKSSLNPQKDKLHVKNPPRLASKDPDQSSFFSLDQTVLNLDQSRIGLAEVIHLPRRSINRSNKTDLENSFSRSYSPRKMDLQNAKAKFLLENVKVLPRFHQSDMNIESEAHQSQPIKRRIVRPKKKEK